MPRQLSESDSTLASAAKSVPPTRPLGCRFPPSSTASAPAAPKAQPSRPRAAGQPRTFLLRPIHTPISISIPAPTLLISAPTRPPSYSARPSQTSHTARASSSHPRPVCCRTTPWQHFRRGRCAPAGGTNSSVATWRACTHCHRACLPWLLRLASRRRRRRPLPPPFLSSWSMHTLRHTACRTRLPLRPTVLPQAHRLGHHRGSATSPIHAVCTEMVGRVRPPRPSRRSSHSHSLSHSHSSHSLSPHQPATGPSYPRLSA